MMATSGRLNLRWDGFEDNRRGELEKFRSQSGFCDVTLVTSNGKQVQANKVILANGSSFFHKILSEHPHPDPVIYLTGVIYEDALSLLDFLYTGEVSIVQKALDQFLNIAQHLEIKSLPSPPHGQMAAQELTSSSRLSRTRGMTSSHSSKIFSQSYSSVDDTSNVKVEDAECYNVPYGMNDQGGPHESCLTSNANVSNISEDSKEEVMDLKEDMFLIESVGSALGNKESIRAATQTNKQSFGEENVSMILARNRDNHIGLNNKKNNSMRVCGVKEETLDSNCEIVVHDWYEQGYENDENMIEDGDEIFSVGRKYFQCSYCTKMFSWASQLKQHKRSHTGEKPFQCLICFKNFSLACNLAKHKKLHTGEKPYQCSICSKKFHQLTNLNVHLKRKNKCSPEF